MVPSAKLAVISEMEGVASLVRNHLYAPSLHSNIRTAMSRVSTSFYQFSVKLCYVSCTSDSDGSQKSRETEWWIYL